MALPSVEPGSGAVTAAAPAGLRDVEFHIGVDDKADYACRLLRKVAQRGLRAVLTGAPEALARLDVQLWTFDPGSFLPHARLRAGERPAAALMRTPIWLVDDLASAAGVLGGADVLVNLGPEVPPQLEGYARLVELVGPDEADLQSGRQRWRAHKAAGLSPRDMRQPGASKA